MQGIQTERLAERPQSQVVAFLLEIDRPEFVVGRRTGRIILDFLRVLHFQLPEIHLRNTFPTTGLLLRPRPAVHLPPQYRQSNQ